MLFSQLQSVVSGELKLAKEIPVTRFSVDSRFMSGAENEVFLALEGKRDGHLYAKSAWNTGVRNFILQEELDLPESNMLIVDDSLRALQSIATHYRNNFEIPVIAITGSNGKTTVKEWLATILSEKFFVAKSPKSYNSQVGVPLSLLEIRKTHELGVFEAGISQRGEMQKLAGMISPSFGIFTNLGEAHDQGFSSTEEKLKEKLMLFHSAQKVVFRKGTANDQLIEDVLGNRGISWSLNGESDYQVNWTGLDVKIEGESYKIDLNNKTQLENITHCIVTSLEMGLSHSQIQQGLNLIEVIPMRLELKRGINNCYVLDDSYNNDEAGLRVALDYLNSHNENEKKVLILSDILHSGKTDSKLYADVAEMLKEKSVDRLIGVGQRISASKKSFGEDALFFEDTNDLLTNLPSFENEMILVKGARDFQLERVVKRLEQISHGTVLEVNFESLQTNLNKYRERLDSRVQLMAMVKANAYGSGILEVANFLQHQRVDILGVAYVNEAIRLRKNGISMPIMIMNPHIDSYEDFERFDLQAEIFSFSHLKRLLSDTKEYPKIHIKIDSGMHRLGFTPDEIDKLISRLLENPDLKVEGIFTHFSSADSAGEDEFTKHQAAVFEEVYDRIVSALGYSPSKHVCNSSGIVRWPQYHFDMVRLGIGLYGFDPTGELELTPSSTLKSVISQIQYLKKGDTVGYGRMGKVERESKIAVVPLGYEDGYQRVFGNGNAKMSVNGKLCPTIGNICMDMTMIDITNVTADEGDEVIVFGKNPSIEDLANWSKTISYEILTNVSNRVKRVFLSE